MRNLRVVGEATDMKDGFEVTDEEALSSCYGLRSWINMRVKNQRVKKEPQLVGTEGRE